MKINPKGLLSDSVWSIAGLVLMNVTAQFVVYPVWNNSLGSEAYGHVLYLISLMNILAISAGTACNSTRMVKSASGQTRNGDYGRIMFLMSAAAIPFGIITYSLNDPTATALDISLYILLIVLTMWRFYSDVRYRLELNYKGYFLYYLCVSLGYIGGVFLFQWTDLWPLALIPGEFLGLLAAYSRRSTIRSGLLQPTAEWKSASHTFFTLMGANVISHIVFNGDRILLNLLLGGNAVTTYYLASLLGKTMTLITTPLSGVILGHLARYKGHMSPKLVNLLLLSCIAFAIISTAVTVTASCILLPVLYPQDSSAVSDYFIIGNLAQIIFFLGNIVTTFLLRFSKVNNQFRLNVIYACSYLILCIPATLKWEFIGFCYSLLIVNIIRIAIALKMCYVASIRISNRKVC